MNPPSILTAVVYGDLETVTTCKERVITRAAALNIDIVGWHHDLDGLKGIVQPGDAPGLVAALGKCLRTRSVLFVPFPQDAPGEQRWRLIAHWLHDHGLRFFLGSDEYHWGYPIDEVDQALREMLEAARNLDVAVIASGAVPALETLLTELLGTNDSQDMNHLSLVLTENQRICMEVLSDMATEIYALHEAAAELMKGAECCLVPDEYQQALSILDMARGEVSALAALIQIHFLAPTEPGRYLDNDVGEPW
jgi:hypothetical protein